MKLIHILLACAINVSLAMKRHDSHFDSRSAKRAKSTSVVANRPWIIYHLQLVEGKHYVGKTQDLSSRIKEHEHGRGAAFTRKYKMLYKKHDELASAIAHDPKDAEDIYTKRLMREFGIENVRGGAYCQLELPDWQIKALEHEKKSRNDDCYRCGEQGHMLADCELSEEEIDHDTEYETDYGTDDDLIEICGRCERDISDHQGGYCSYNTDIDGNFIGYKRRIYF